MPLFRRENALFVFLRDCLMVRSSVSLLRFMGLLLHQDLRAFVLEIVCRVYSYFFPPPFSSMRFIPFPSLPFVMLCFFLLRQGVPLLIARDVFVTAKPSYTSRQSSSR